jgi:hypothetical protein
MWHNSRILNRVFRDRFGRWRERDRIWLECLRRLVERLPSHMAVDRHHRRRHMAELRPDDSPARPSPPASSAPCDGRRGSGCGRALPPPAAIAMRFAMTSSVASDRGACSCRATGKGNDLGPRSPAPKSGRAAREAPPGTCRSATGHATLPESSTDGSRASAAPQEMCCHWTASRSRRSLDGRWSSRDRYRQSLASSRAGRNVPAISQTQG